MTLVLKFRSLRFDIDASSSGQNKVHAPIVTRARHRQHLESACKFLEAFKDLRESFCPLHSAAVLNPPFDST